MRNFDVRIIPKIIIIGDPAVGKTTICNRYLGCPFEHRYISTIGVDFFSKDSIYETHSGIRVMVSWSLWDIAGQVRFRDIVDQFFKGANSAIVVYDITDRESFENVKNWLQRFWDVAGEKPAVIVGNKTDLRDKKGQVSTEEGKELAEELSKEKGMPFFFVETSAKFGENLDLLFRMLFNAVIWIKIKEKEERNR
ncbi:MAG: Rab family GTPase [Candidatus Njordarchaeia archaeon]